ncbi:hypothetical protein ACHWQZ_G008119 [Mnemiopsis leidyi]
MKYLVVFALVALVAARPDDGDRPRPKPKGPAIFVRPVHRAAQNESYEFKFGIAGMKELDESEVSLWKVVRGEKGPELAETDFDVELKTLTEEEIKEWIEEKKEKMKEILERLEDKREEIKEWIKEKKGDIKEWIEAKKEAIRERIGDEKFEMLKEWIEEKKEAIKEWIEEKKAEREGDERRPKPHPRPHFKHAIVGKVTVSGVSCDDQGPYLVRYGSKDDDKKEKEAVEGKDGESKRRPSKPRGAFLILVKGCKRPEPEED